MPRKKNIWAYFATVGPIGYCIAPGTVATFMTLPIVYILKNSVSHSEYILAVFVLFLMSFVVIKKALPSFGVQDDPSEIVLDEVVGCLLTYWMIPISTQAILVGFLLFRTLDIIKFGWIKRAESLADAWGIMGDDILAASIANILLRFLYPI